LLSQVPSHLIPNTIRSRVVALFALVTVVVLAFLLQFFPAKLQQYATRALQDKAESVGAMSAFSVRSAVFFDDVPAIDEALLGALENEDLLYIAVSDSLGHVLAIKTAQGWHEASPLGTQLPSEPDAYHQTTPIVLNGRTIGKVRLAITMEPVWREVLHARWITAGVIGLVFGLGLSVVVIISGVITKPLDRMVRTAERIASGSLAERADVSSSAEVRRLAETFNVMVDRLQESASKLRDANQRLENQVIERTRDWRIESRERRRVEAERGALERFYEQLLDEMPAEVAVFDAEGRVRYVNPAGVADPEVREWLIGKTVDDYVRRLGLNFVESKPSWRDVVNECRRTLRSVTFEQTVADAVGTTRHYIRSLCPIATPDGKIDRLIGYGLDVTQLKTAEQALDDSAEQLRQMQKLEAVGRLAAGVAHDFNNILTVISGNTALLQLELNGDAATQESMDDITAAVESAQALTRQLLAFSRKQVLQPEILDLNDVVERVSKMLKRLLGEDIDIVDSLSPLLGSVEADPGQIEQVIMNLAVNARDAMPNGGRLRIATTNCELDEKFANTHAGAKPGLYVSLGLSDNGTGMAETVREQIFDPFSGVWPLPRHAAA